MGIKGLDELYDMLCEELEQLTEKGELSAGSLEVAEKLTTTMKNIGKIMEQHYEMEESREGGSYARNGRMGGSYARGRSNRSYEGGSYARAGRGRNARRDSMGRYMDGSFDDGKAEMMDMLDDLMQTAPEEKYKTEIRRFMSKLEQM